ncbi:hypothetical protein ACFL2U_00425 [Patescibacteria group bacterium]
MEQPTEKIPSRAEILAKKIETAMSDIAKNLELNQEQKNAVLMNMETIFDESGGEEIEKIRKKYEQIPLYGMNFLLQKIINLPQKEAGLKDVLTVLASKYGMEGDLIVEEASKDSSETKDEAARENIDDCRVDLFILFACENGLSQLLGLENIDEIKTFLKSDERIKSIIEVFKKWEKEDPSTTANSLMIEEAIKNL